MTKEELQATLDAICKQNGFDRAMYLGNYKGEDIYKPVFDLAEGEEAFYGRPCYLHVKGENIRRSKDFKEVLKIMHYFFPKKN